MVKTKDTDLQKLNF